MDADKLQKSRTTDGQPPRPGFETAGAPAENWNIIFRCPKCLDGWICEEHPDKPWPHDDCSGPGMPCDMEGCTRSLAIRDRGEWQGGDE